MFDLLTAKYIIIVLFIALGISVYFNVKLRLEMTQHDAKAFKLIQKAYYNPVTSLPNLANIQMIIDEHISKANRHKKPFLLAVIKVKNYYDVQAHAQKYADALMIDIGKKLKILLRSEDIVAHTTHNGFVILFNEYFEEENYEILFTRIKNAFKDRLQVNEKTSFEFKISIGSAVFGEKLASSEALLNEATRQALD